MPPRSRGQEERWSPCAPTRTPSVAEPWGRDLDYPVALAAACAVAAATAPRTFVVGNFNPVAGLLVGGPAQVQEVCRSCERQAAGCDNFILSPGCEVPPATPAENYEALVRFGWRFGQP